MNGVYIMKYKIKITSNYNLKLLLNLNKFFEQLKMTNLSLPLRDGLNEWQSIHATLTFKYYVNHIDVTHLTIQYTVTLQTLLYNTQWHYKHYFTIHSDITNITIQYTVTLQTLLNNT